MIEQHRTELASVCQRFGVRKLDLFGSALREDFSSAHSDLDFVVQFRPTGTTQGSADRYFGLLESLEMLFQRQVDLLQDHAIRNPYLRRTIEENRLTVYGE
jgi:hypothetical protein